jgi:hypothetical protein
VAGLLGTPPTDARGCIVLGHVLCHSACYGESPPGKLFSALDIHDCESFAVTVVSIVIKTVVTVMVDCSAW